MIPKVIHYCWFGGNPLPEEAQKCIESWKKYCPDFEIKEWNESNYDVTQNTYMYDAYKAKKWAFVSDYARIDIIYNYGGIYMDTDVELLKSLEPFLNNEMYCGWEKSYDGIKNCVAFGLGFGAVQGHPALKDLMRLYGKLSFYKEDGSINNVPCPVYQTEILERYGVNTAKPTYQELEKVKVYPTAFFAPMDYQTGELTVTDETYSIHWFAASWHSTKERKWNSVSQKVYMRLGKENGQKFCNSISWRVIGHLYVDGFRGTVNKIVKKCWSKK